MDEEVSEEHCPFRCSESVEVKMQTGRGSSLPPCYLFLGCHQAVFCAGHTEGLNGFSLTDSA